MTGDEITKLATAAKIFDLYGQQAKQRTTNLLSEKELKRFQDFLEALEKFAGLVAAHEREACLELIAEHIRMFDAMEAVDAIRARGQG